VARRTVGIRRPTPRPRRGLTAKATLPGVGALPSGTGLVDVQPAMNAMRQATRGQATTNSPGLIDTEPLPRHPAAFVAAFGPGVPLVPQALQPSPTPGGQAEPRRWEYPITWNLSTASGRPVPWATLRDTATIDLVRRCIEKRKSEHVGQPWDFTLTPRAMESAGADTPAEQRAMREQYADHISRLTEWWGTPDKTNDLPFDQWLSNALEELLVLDALAIFPRVTYGGQLASLEIVDGATIKPLLDVRGNRPTPPDPAYQQWLYGFPRGEYTRGSEEAGWEGQAGDLIYTARTVRSTSPYGYSPVEQSLQSASLWIHRQQWMSSEYTDGTLPTSFLTVDDTAASMTPEQLRAWEVSLNDYYEGSNGNRHRLRLLPGGVAPVSTSDVAERYSPDYDYFLVKLVCSHFDVDPTEIGFAPSGGLGGKGFSAGQQDTKWRSAIEPWNRFLSSLINRISAQYLGMPPELTHAFLGAESEDEKSADDIGAARVNSGRATLNEDRDRAGMPRYDGEWADTPMVMTGSGPVWIPGAWDDAMAPPAPVPAALVAAQGGVPPSPDAAPRPESASPPGSDGPDYTVKTDRGDARGRAAGPSRTGPAEPRQGRHPGAGTYRPGFTWDRA